MTSLVLALVALALLAAATWRARRPISDERALRAARQTAARLGFSPDVPPSATEDLWPPSPKATAIAAAVPASVAVGMAIIEPSRMSVASAPWSSSGHLLWQVAVVFATLSATLGVHDVVSSGAYVRAQDKEAGRIVAARTDVRDFLPRQERVRLGITLALIGGWIALLGGVIGFTSDLPLAWGLLGTFALVGIGLLLEWLAACRAARAPRTGESWEQIDFRDAIRRSVLTNRVDQTRLTASWMAMIAATFPDSLTPLPLLDKALSVAGVVTLMWAIAEMVMWVIWAPHWRRFGVTARSARSAERPPVLPVDLAVRGAGR